MIGFLLRLAGNAAAIWVAVYFVAGITLAEEVDDTTTRVLLYVGVALVFTIVNAIIKPILVVLSLPLLILTLGVFYLVVNAFMLMLTAWLSQQFGWGFDVDGFGAAVIGGIIVSLVNMAISLLVPSRR